MGIRGLTAFINTNCKDYLEEYHLQDTYLVIDGYNIALQLYTWHCKRNDCFGGDYDKYAKVVHEFFKLLESCKVTPLILFDGGFENKKFQTIYSRFKSKIKTASHLTSVSQGVVTMFPLCLRDLFVDIVLELGLKAVQCDLEADYELACVAKSLNCPVLSYDSDFYIFGALYIPFSTFQMRTRKLKKSPESYFIPCQIYKIEIFLKSVGLSKENLPLFATLLGNDYIKMSIFQQFYDHLQLPKNKQGTSAQQVKILGVLKWLKNQSYNSAVTKILSKLKHSDRKYVAEQIKISSETYLNSNSKVLQYLNLNVSKPLQASFSYTFNTDEYLQSVDCIAQIDKDVTSISNVSVDNINVPNAEASLKLNNTIPDWFKVKFRRCEYPQTFMNILSHNVHISTPQVEDYTNVCSHTISVPILSAIQKILLSALNENLTYIVRTDHSARISNLKIPFCTKHVPKLSDIMLLTSEESKAILFDILNITYSSELNELFNILPTTWQLYFLSVIYWIHNANPKVTYSHVYSVILCVFTLNEIDPKIDFCRSTNKFERKFAETINSFVNDFKSSSSKIHFSESLNNISYEECLLGFKHLIDYFQMNQRMRSYKKLFDIHIIDSLAQFQSCLFHIRYLNILLNKPFCNFVISKFYDGTFLFNMSLDLCKRTDIDAYLGQTLLKYCPNVLNCLRKIIEIITKISSNDISTNNNKRRRKRKKALPTDSREVGVDVNHNSEDENIVDIHNRFFVLSLKK